jgi:AcrR family transcriptional regulator
MDRPASSESRRGTEPNEAPAGESSASTVRHDFVAVAILAEAARIFASRGVQGTGIREIAEAMEMSRPGVYHYFSSKDELLVQLLEGYTGQLTGFFRAVREDAGKSPSEKLREMVTGLVIRVTEKPSYLRLMANNEQELPEHLAKAHADARHEAFEHMIAVIAEGIDAGELRPVNERIAAFGLFGMCHWIAWWYRPEGAASADEIAEELSELALAGLLRPERRRTGGGLQHAIEMLSEDLEYLQRITRGTA